MIKVSSKSTLPKSIVEGDFILVDTKGNEKEARRIVDSLRGKKVVIGIVGYNDAFNRRIVETIKINFLINPERIVKDKRDNLKQRDSGLNHVVAKEAAKKNIAIVIDFDYIKSLSKKDATIVTSRIIQNIKICRRAKCSIKIMSESEDKKGLEAFCFSIGMSSQQVKASQFTVENKLDKK